jgi:hypothetical protein
MGKTTVCHWQQGGEHQYSICTVAGGIETISRWLIKGNLYAKFLMNLKF